MTSCMNVSLDNFLSFDDAKVRLFSLPRNFFCIKVQNCVRKRLRTQYIQPTDLQQSCDCRQYKYHWAIP